MADSRDLEIQKKQLFLAHRIRLKDNAIDIACFHSQIGHMRFAATKDKKAIKQITPRTENIIPDITNPFDKAMLDTLDDYIVSTIDKNVYSQMTNVYLDMDVNLGRDGTNYASFLADGAKFLKAKFAAQGKTLYLILTSGTDDVVIDASRKLTGNVSPEQKSETEEAAKGIVQPKANMVFANKSLSFKAAVLLLTPGCSLANLSSSGNLTASNSPEIPAPAEIPTKIEKEPEDEGHALPTQKKRPKEPEVISPGDEKSSPLLKHIKSQEILEVVKPYSDGGQKLGLFSQPLEKEMSVSKEEQEKKGQEKEGSLRKSPSSSSSD